MVDVVIRGALGALLVLVLGAGPANAHAAFLGSDPEDGSSRETPPTTLTLRFNENIASPAYVVLTAPDGTRVGTSDVSILDGTVTATVAAADQRGEYTVAYRVVSADGHPIGGQFAYTVTTGRVVEQVTPDTPQESFLHRHDTHLLWGLGAAAVAIGLLLAPLWRRRHAPHDA